MGKIGTEATISAPGWEVRAFEETVKRLPKCAVCGGEMTVKSRSNTKKPTIVCHADGCRNNGRLILPHAWVEVV